MAHGGRRPGAGRKKGIPNKETKVKLAAVRILSEGETPLEYMLSLLRQKIPDDVDPCVKHAMSELRFEAAKAAAPYIHPKLSAIQHTGKNGDPIDLHWTVEVVSPVPLTLATGQS